MDAFTIARGERLAWNTDPISGLFETFARSGVGGTLAIFDAAARKAPFSGMIRSGGATEQQDPTIRTHEHHTGGADTILRFRKIDHHAPKSVS